MTGKITFPPVPTSFTPEQQQYMRDKSVAMGKYLRERITRNTPVDQVLLVSPSKKIYAVTVSDAGTLSATLVQE